MKRRDRSSIDRGGEQLGPNQRQLRVGEELRHALAHTLERGHFRDPVLMDTPITVTEVRVSPDLKNATAYVTPLGGKNVDEVVAALRRAAPYFRGQIARIVKLRVAPNVTFAADTSFDYASRISGILHSPDVARDLNEAGDEDEGLADDRYDDGESPHR